MNTSGPKELDLTKVRGRRVKLTLKQMSQLHLINTYRKPVHTHNAAATFKFPLTWFLNHQYLKLTHHRRASDSKSCNSITDITADLWTFFFLLT